MIHSCVKRPLEAVLTFNMNQDEAKAYKLCLLWEDLVQKEFPKYDGLKLRKKGDPRKSTLFKYCYKLVLETRGLIEDKDYKFYILAQLQVLKSIKSGDIHALIHPTCLVGNKAWKRWKFWKSRFDKKVEESKTSNQSGIKIPILKFKVDLEKTRDFLKSHFGRTPDITCIKFAHEKGFLKKWQTLKKISSYYLAMSPLVNSCTNYDLDVYKLKDKIYLEAFKSIFPEEFNTNEDK